MKKIQRRKSCKEIFTMNCVMEVVTYNNYKNIVKVGDFIINASKEISEDDYVFNVTDIFITDDDMPNNHRYCISVDELSEEDGEYDHWLLFEYDTNKPIFYTTPCLNCDRICKNRKTKEEIIKLFKKGYPR